jgi:hypothetical protein
MEGFWLRAPPEAEFFKFYGAQELISRNVVYVARQASTITLFLLGSWPP